MLLLVHPPVVKPSEPPPGIAALTGALQRYGVPCALFDANLEGLLWLLDLPLPAADPWSRRAVRNRARTLTALRSPDTYQHLDRYKRAVADLNRVVTLRGAAAGGAHLSLANYHHRDLSPVRSVDLLKAAENPETNPFFPYFRDRIIDFVEAQGVSGVGLSLNYLSQALCTFAMAGFVRKRYPRVTIILGGGLTTSWLSNPGWHDPFSGLIDHLVAGPGERALLSLLGIETSDSATAFPEYAALPLDNYMAPGRIIPYAASRGCYWNQCRFCPERAERNHFFPLAPAQAVQDLHMLIARFQPALIHFVDNALSPALLKALAASPLGAPWYGFARATAHLADPDFCKALKHSGCVMLKLGLESGDQGVLDALGKGIDVETASQALRALKQAGIAVYGYFLFGTPAEDLLSARKTLAFVAEHSPELDFLNLAIFNLPRYSADAEAMETKRFYEGDLSLYSDFAHPRGWGRRKVREFLDREFRRHPAVATILRHHPPLFTSNHAAFLATRLHRHDGR